jgi:hypothetical protein
MAPMRTADINHSGPFDTAVAALRVQYPDIDTAVDDLKDALRLDYDLPEYPIDGGDEPDIYSARLDYPPLGASGMAKFLVTYHATKRTPGWHQPYRTVTLLSIEDREAWAAP